MSGNNLPDMKRKQKILFDEGTSPETLIAQGQQFLAAGWYSDAIDFFMRAEHAEGLSAMRHKAQEEGDVFLLTRCLKAQDEEADSDEWRHLADRALALGKLQFAREGYRLAGDRKAMDKVDAQIAPPQSSDDTSAQSDDD